MRAFRAFFRKIHLIMTKAKKQIKIDAFSKAISKDPTNRSLLQKLNTKVKFTTLSVPVKSASDKKEYKVIRLENGLTVCLISDTSPLVYNSDEDDSYASESEEEEDEDTEETDEESEDDDLPPSPEEKMAAAALCIGVGSFSDPKTVQGMAHFLEHMVFMGSKKYPEENDFDSFISKRGGSDNASTDFEATTFYFECLEKHLYAALDKFAQFFISPLMKKTAITREREAIESEFQVAVPSDTNRTEQLLLSFAKKDSPVNTFTWGNLTTLRDQIDEDELYEKLHEFRKRHYSAHRMTLALQARLPMETLEAFVLDCFGPVPTNSLPPDDFKMYKNVFDTPEFKRIYYIKPNCNITTVELTFGLPSLLHKYRSKPLQYVSWILGYEGKGSLLSYLRKKVWVLSMSVGNSESGSEHNSMYALFSLNMNMTVDGMHNLDRVIELVFSYVKLMRDAGPQKWLFEEIQKIEGLAFRFQSEEASVDVVESVAEAMHFFPPEEYLTGSELYKDYDPEAFTMVTNALNPDEMNIMVLSNDFPATIELEKTEQWFGTKYTDAEIPESWLEKWRNVEVLDEFTLPEPNRFVVENVDILAKDKICPPEYPEKVLSNDSVELWYRKDEKFELPFAFCCLQLINPEAIVTPITAVMLDFFVNILELNLVEEAYPAQIADFMLDFTADERGLIVKLKGYNEKLHLVIELISTHLVNFNENLREDFFDAIKDKLKKHYYNWILNPKNIAKDGRLKLIVNKHHTFVEKYNAISAITYDNIKQFGRDFIAKLYIKALIQGNITNDDATKIITNFLAQLKSNPISKETYPTFQVLELPKGEVLCRIQSFNPENCNSIVTSYYQSGTYTIKDSVIIETLMLLIQEPLFDTLRTKEQLGYNVYSSLRETYGVLGFTITVNTQATKNTTQHVNMRIDDFIKKATNLINQTTSKQFNEIRHDLIKTKQCIDVHLKEEVIRNWGEIIEDNYKFDILKQEIKAIEELRIIDVKNWWKEQVGYENIRKISIQVVGFNTKKKSSTAKSLDNYGKEVNIKFMEINEDDPTETVKECIKSFNAFIEKKNYYPEMTVNPMPK